MFIFVYTLINCNVFLFDTMLHIANGSKVYIFKSVIEIFSLKMDCILPLSALLAGTHTIISLKESNEIFALRTLGASKIFLTLPFLLFCLLCSSITYVNYFYVTPKYISNVNQERQFVVNYFSDGTKAIYKKDGQKISDFYWIKSKSEIIHCKNVEIIKETLVGNYVDHFIKNCNNNFKLIDYSESCQLPKTLLNQFNNDETIVELFYKIISPWFSTIFIFIILPNLFIFTKKFSPFKIYSIGIFSFIIFNAVLKTSIILSENYIISPIVGIIVLPLLVQLFLTYKVYRV